MAKPDRHFINVFSAVLGILVAIALVLIGVSRLVDSGPKGARDTGDPLMQASAQERIKPVGQVAVSGEDNSAKEIQKTTVAVAAAPALDANQPMDGKTVYQNSCNACHGSGGWVHGVAVCAAWKRKLGTHGTHSSPAAAIAASRRTHRRSGSSRRRARTSAPTSSSPTAPSR